VNYSGNHTYHQPISRLPNAFWSPSSPVVGANKSLPTSRPNAALGSVTEFYSGNSSNFNGVIAMVTSRINWLTLQLNYALGHALDESSNGGFDAFGVNTNTQINPNNIRQNYGNADYDTRQYLSANYAITVPHFHGNRLLVDNWEFDGTIFHNSGYPFSVTDNTGEIAYGTVALAKQLDNNFNHKCGGKSHTVTACDFASHFTNSTDYGQQARNQLYGPSFTDFDLDVAKGFKVPGPEAAKLKIGVQFFNLFNHANFQIPSNDVNDSNNGVILTTANTPTSILGAFLGGDASPRLVELKAVFNF
jgi:hypothetical protein